MVGRLFLTQAIEVRILVWEQIILFVIILESWITVPRRPYWTTLSGKTLSPPPDDDMTDYVLIETNYTHPDAMYKQFQTEIRVPEEFGANKVFMDEFAVQVVRAIIDLHKYSANKIKSRTNPSVRNITYTAGSGIIPQNANGQQPF